MKRKLRKGIEFIIHLKVLAILAASVCLFPCRDSQAQDLVTQNRNIAAIVSEGDGSIWILKPPVYVADKTFLNFPGKSYFSCKVDGQVFTNNDNGGLFGDPYSFLYAPDIFTMIGDTIHAVWQNRNGIDVIQDVWPVDYDASGQIVMRWSFHTKDSATSHVVSCQWLNDLDISDPTDHHSKNVNANDGPNVLTNFWYTSIWQQYPSSTSGGPIVPWLYSGFLYNLPGPGLDPGISGTGFLDDSTLGEKPPAIVTIGDWREMSLWSYGSSQFSNSLGHPFGPDCAVLLEWGQTITDRHGYALGGQTSYGTDEFFRCAGNMFGVGTCPHRIDWNPNTLQYSPSPFKITFLAINYIQFPAQHTQFSLTAGPHLQLCTPAGILINGGTYQVQPPLPGDYFANNQVIEYDWFEKVAPPVEFCKGDVQSQILIHGFSATVDSPIYIDHDNSLIDTCEHPIILGCAELDHDPPLFEDTLVSEFTYRQRVHDDRTTDRGLDSIILERIVPSGNASNFLVYLDTADIKPCAVPTGDKAQHLDSIQQIDSTIAGCLYFRFVDCVGNTSFDTICFAAHKLYVVPDTVPPLIVITDTTGSYGNSKCNYRHYALLASDEQLHDLGLDSLYVIPGSVSNMTYSIPKFAKGVGEVNFTASVIDSMVDGTICFRAVDVAHNRTDFCIHYCTIPDTTPPIVVITPDPAHTWKWQVCVYDTAAWDRGLGTVQILSGIDLLAPTPPLANADGQHIFCFEIQAADTTQIASFCVQSIDSMGNLSNRPCVSSSVEPDTIAPNIYLYPNQMVHTTTDTVVIGDVHWLPDPYVTGDSTKYVWDTGLDSVWFTDNTGVKTPGNFHVACVRSDTAALFLISVLDSLDVDSISCVTIHASDCQGNQDSVRWCYSYQEDIHPPFLVVKYLDKLSISISVTDTQLYDRGLGYLRTSNVFNVPTIADTIGGAPYYQTVIQRPNLDMTSLATVSAVDKWGAVANIPLGHTATAPIDVRIQDMALHSSQAPQPQTLIMPVYLIHNDTIPVERKAITSIEFNFSIVPANTLIRFAGVLQPSNALTNSWTIDTGEVGSVYFVKATAPQGVVLGPAVNDTVMCLLFKTSITDTSQVAAVQIVPIGSESIVYNNGQDSVITSANSISTMPPPWGSLTGGSLLMLGTCVPSLQTLGPGQPASITAGIPSPNPSAHAAEIQYVLTQKTAVHITIVDLLGRTVRSVFDGDGVAGVNTIQIDLNDLPNGQYTVRLETSSGVALQKLVIQR